jgi:hypothetical protein
MPATFPQHLALSAFEILAPWSCRQVLTLAFRCRPKSAPERGRGGPRTTEHAASNARTFSSRGTGGGRSGRIGERIRAIGDSGPYRCQQPISKTPGAPGTEPRPSSASIAPEGVGSRLRRAPCECARPPWASRDQQKDINWRTESPYTSWVARDLFSASRESRQDAARPEYLPARDGSSLSFPLDSPLSPRFVRGEGAVQVNEPSRLRGGFSR